MTQKLTETPDGSHWIRGVIRLRFPILAFFGLLSAASLPGLALLDVDNRAQVFFPSDSDALERYGRFNRLFGGDRAVRLAVSVNDGWTAQHLEWLRVFEAKLSALPGVGFTVGLASLHTWHMAWPPPDAWSETALDDRFHRSASLQSRDGRTISLIVGLMPLVPEGTRLVLDRLEALAASAPSGVHVQVAGIPIVSRALDEGVFQVMTTIFPIIVIAAALIMLGVVRSPIDTVLPLLFVGACLGTLFGVMGWLGVTLDIAVGVVAPLVFVIALATAVHLLLGFRARQHAGASSQEAVEQVYAEKGWAVFWTCATTGLAFASLLTARVPPVQSMGLWASLGLAFVAVAAFTFYPALLAVLATRVRPEGEFERRCRALGPRLADFASLHRSRVVLGSAALAVASLLGVSQLDFDSSVLRYFDADHPVRVGVESLERAGLSVATAELVLHKGPQSPGFRTGVALARLDGLASELEEDPQIPSAVSAGSLAAAALRWVPEAGDLAGARDRLEASESSRLLLGALVTPDGASARLITSIPMRGYQELDPVFERITSLARSWFPEAEVELTGQYPLVLSAQREMFRTLVKSLSATCVGVLLVLLIVIRNIRMTLRAFFPNLLPVVVLLGAIGVFGFPLNSGTVTVPAVALGLAVDDTLHTLAHFRRLLPTLGSRRAIAKTLELTTGAHVLTALVLVAGFLCVGVSELRPIAEFGLLLAAGVGLALLGDLLLIPALLGGLSSRDGEGSEGEDPFTPVGRASA